MKLETVLLPPAKAERLLGAEASDFRVIIVFAQVGEDEHLCGTIKIFRQEVGRGPIREVPMAAHHPLLDEPGIRSHFQHIQIMIRFED